MSFDIGDFYGDWEIKMPSAAAEGIAFTGFHCSAPGIAWCAPPADAQ